MSNPLKVAFSNHSRQWRSYRYCYPVVSRRSRGLSLGVNLNPDTACNFDCIYCCVDRLTPPAVRTVDLAVLEEELRALARAALAGELYSEPEFREIPAEFRRINDIAFSGDGEPTASPEFRRAAEVAVRVRAELGLLDAKIITITDACFLKRPAVADTLAFLDGHRGEIWAKLDAGTQAYYELVNRPSHPLEHVLENILFAARIRPLVIQSIFMRIRGEAPPPAELDAYARRIEVLVAQGARLSLVQVYTIARRTAVDYVERLSADELESIAQRVRRAGVPAETYP
ncbi:MAG: hypothetical protein CHACPFDD_02939 [Phycisphaerae bacterium]|nr:hypothetical protein [Phycisphaerae bacterium]